MSLVSRAFISHASVDKDYFRVLAYHFERSGLHVWDYRDSSKPTLGRMLDEELRLAIAGSQLFVFMCSPTSLSNDFVRREVEILRESAASVAVFSVALPGAPSRGLWPQPFSTLAGQVYDRVRSIDDMQGFVQGVLRQVGVAFVPRSSPRRLPVFERTVRELSQWRVVEGRERVASLDLASLVDFNAVFAHIDRSNHAYQEKEYRAATLELQRAETQLASLAPGFRPYYLGIAQTVCDLHLGRNSMAEERLGELSSHELCDESWHAAIGVLRIRSRRFADARAAYEAAYRECQRKGESVLEVLVHLSLLDTLQGGSAVPGWNVPPSIPLQERITLATIEASAWLACGEPGRAHSLLSGFALSAHDDRSLSVLAHALEELGDPFGAHELLWSFLRAQAPAPLREWVSRWALLLRCAARCSLAMDEMDAALAVYERYLCAVSEPRLIWLIEHARFLRLAGRRTDSERVCAEIMKRPPESAEDWYCAGFAAHLLGDIAVADRYYAFARRGDYDEPPYADVLTLDGDA